MLKESSFYLFARYLESSVGGASRQSGILCGKRRHLNHLVAYFLGGGFCKDVLTLGSHIPRLRPLEIVGAPYLHGLFLRNCTRIGCCNLVSVLNLHRMTPTEWKYSPPPLVKAPHFQIGSSIILEWEGGSNFICFGIQSHVRGALLECGNLANNSQVGILKLACWGCGTLSSPLARNISRAHQSLSAVKR